MNFIDILKDLNIATAPEGHEHTRPGWIQFDCPFCGKGTDKFHMGYSLSGGFTNCWRCGSHSAAAALVEITGLSFGEIKKLLKDVLPETIAEVKRKGKLVVPMGVGRLLPAHKTYLKFRDLNYKKLERLWQIKGLGIAAELSWRIFIPVFFHGEVVSWTTRSIGDIDKRYIHANTQQESMNRNELLYGEDFCRHAIIICEGPVDVWKIGPGAIALLGLNYSQQQFQRILKYSLRAVCFDNEPEAQRRANMLVDDLSVFPGDTYNIQLDSDDAGCACEKELKRIRKLLHR